MKKNNKSEHKPKLVYKDDAMSQGICLICGDRLGKYEYKGKAVCSECIKSIRERF